MREMKRVLLDILGYTSVVLGFVGVFVPMLPTTPFLLLAVWCFSRSSPGMNAWLLHNRFFGKYLTDYETGLGIPLVVKLSALITMWGSMTFTAIVFIDSWWLRGLLWAIALFVTIHILHIKTLHREGK